MCHEQTLVLPAKQVADLAYLLGSLKERHRGIHQTIIRLGLLYMDINDLLDKAAEAEAFQGETRGATALNALSGMARDLRTAVNAVRTEYPDPMAPGLWFFAVSEGGGPYEFQEYKDMLAQAGFSDVVDVGTQPIRAIKRAGWIPGEVTGSGG